MQFCSGAPIHFFSGVNIRAVLGRLSTDIHVSNIASKSVLCKGWGGDSGRHAALPQGSSEFVAAANLRDGDAG